MSLQHNTGSEMPYPYGDNLLIGCSDPFVCETLEPTPITTQAHSSHTMHTSQPLSAGTTIMPKIILNPPAPILIFDEDHVDLFFQRFESRHRLDQSSDADLFDKLLQCLNYSQQSRVNRVLSDGNCSYGTLKKALLTTYGRTLEQAQEDLSFAPELGDKLPSEMLAQLRSLLGRHLREQPLLEHSLRREWLARLPPFARDLLTLMDNPTLEKMAEKADQLINDRRRRHATPTLQSSYLHAQSTHAPQQSNSASQFKQALDEITQRLNTVVAMQASMLASPTPSQQAAPNVSSQQLSKRPGLGVASPHTRRDIADKHTYSVPEPSFSGTSSVPLGSDICWYHYNYGQRAHRCAPGCKFQSRNLQQPPRGPLNSRGGASPRFHHPYHQ